MRNKNWLRTDFDKLVLQIDGEEYQVASCTATFAINEIPRATCLIAVGRKTLNVDEQAKIHTTINNLTGLKPAKIIAKMDGDFDFDNKWPGEQVLFDGYFTGIAHRKVTNKMQVVVQLVHWLAALTWSSTLSAASHPSNPARATYQAMHGRLESGAGGRPQNIGSYIGISVERKVRADLWSSIKDFCCKLAKRDMIKRRGPAGFLGAGEESNDKAIAALARIEDASSDECPFTGDEKFGVPLKFDIGGGGLSTNFDIAVATSIGKEAIDSYAHTTFWDKIVGQWANKFLFALVPMVEQAAVVPYQPGSREIYDVELLPEDYNFIDFNSVIPKPMRSVAVYGGEVNRTLNYPAQQPGDPQEIGIGGFYRPPAQDPDCGAALFLQAPEWMQRILSVTRYAGASTGIKGNLATPTSTQPDPDPPKPEDPAPEAIRPDVQNVYDKYAQSVFVREALRGRVGSITGKLRFDIAPGSTIKLKGEPEKFIGGEDDLATTMIGHVVRVSYSISAEDAHATTSYKISHLRTEAENEKDATSVAKHPLYTDVYKGAPLIPALKF